MGLIKIIVIIVFVVYTTCTNGILFGGTLPPDHGSSVSPMYSFTHLEFKWQDSLTREKALQDETFIIENNIIAGIKVYGGSVFVTVPRWRRGIPATLNVLVEDDVSGQTLLKPYPSWEMNTIGNCSSFQYVQGMEVDTNTGYMWVIDTGRVNTLEQPSIQRNLCPAKLTILDIQTGTVVSTYSFPSDVVPPDNFLNDIVLDYQGGVAKYAYITDTAQGKLIAFDVERHLAYAYEHESMKKTELLPSQQNLLTVPIDGIAMSPDFNFVYYCTLPSHELYAITTSVLRSGNASLFAEHVIHVGAKAGGSDGMIFGQQSLFYGSLEDNAVYSAHAGARQLVDLSTEQVLIKDDVAIVWVDTLAFNNTDLWFIANSLNKFAQHTMNFNASDANMYIWKVNVHQHGYLYDADRRTAHITIPSIIG